LGTSDTNTKSDHVAGPSFREWLATRLAATTYATREIPDEKIDAVASSIGVQVDLLLEVRAEARIRQRKRGLPFRRALQAQLFMPDVIFRAWQEETEFRGVDGSVLLRSLIHAYLLDGREPENLLDHWLWNGQTYRVDYEGVRHRTAKREQAKIPVGAWRALKLRATRLGVSRATIMRSLVLETLQGEHRTVRLVQPGIMFDDETRYYMP